MYWEAWKSNTLYYILYSISFHRNPFWEYFGVPDPETTSFGVPSNVNSRAPSPETPVSDCYTCIQDEDTVYDIPNNGVSGSQLHLHNQRATAHIQDSIQDLPPAVNTITSRHTVCMSDIVLQMKQEGRDNPSSRIMPVSGPIPHVFSEPLPFVVSDNTNTHKTSIPASSYASSSQYSCEATSFYDVPVEIVGSSSEGLENRTICQNTSVNKTGVIPDNISKAVAESSIAFPKPSHYAVPKQLLGCNLYEEKEQQPSRTCSTGTSFSAEQEVEVATVSSQPDDVIYHTPKPFTSEKHKMRPINMSTDPSTEPNIDDPHIYDNPPIEVIEKMVFDRDSPPHFASSKSGAYCDHEAIEETDATCPGLDR